VPLRFAEASRRRCEPDRDREAEGNHAYGHAGASGRAHQAGGSDATSATEVFRQRSLTELCDRTHRRNRQDQAGQPPQHGAGIAPLNRASSVLHDNGHYRRGNQQPPIITAASSRNQPQLLAIIGPSMRSDDQLALRAGRMPPVPLTYRTVWPRCRSAQCSINESTLGDRSHGIRAISRSARLRQNDSEHRTSAPSTAAQ
jgi:hypothetical protein